MIRQIEQLTNDIKAEEIFKRLAAHDASIGCIKSHLQKKENSQHDKEMD